MRSRLLVRAAALILTTGGLMMIPASPASADCSHGFHPDRYDVGGIGWEITGTRMRHGPHVPCNTFAWSWAGDGIDVHCSANFVGSANDWVYARNLSHPNRNGWAREGMLDTAGGNAGHRVADCVDPNDWVLIGDV